jgi:queuosine precursor transporter
MILIYLFSITLANIIILQFGPSMTPITGFLLIGLDLVLRDKLSDKLSAAKMLTMIVAAGLITLAINRDAMQIAVASSLSFSIASVADWIVFKQSVGTWSARSHKSNAVGAVVDSVLFPTIAFGALMPTIVIGQIAAKFLGAALWVRILEVKK